MSKPRRPHDESRLAFGQTVRHSALEGGHRVEAVRLAIRQRPHRRGCGVPRMMGETTEEEDLFRARLDQIIDMKHELVKLAGRLD
jgi:hypothetical protein